MRILLVEDDLNLAQFIRKGLKEEQYAVDFAADGEAGLELALNNPYDLLILDVMLPKQDGSGVAFGADAAAEGEAVQLGQHDVQDQKVVRVIQGQL